MESNEKEGSPKRRVNSPPERSSSKRVTSPEERSPRKTISPLEQSPTKQQNSPEKTPSKRSVAEKTPNKKMGSPTEKSPVKKRQRNPVKRFDIDEEIVKSARKRRLSGEREALFDKGSFLAVRADRGQFYICQALINVYNHYKTFKVRWLEIEQPPHLYKKAYEDSVDLDCVIAKVEMSPQRRGMLALFEGEAERVQKLLQAAEAGMDVTRLDVTLFSPSTKKRKVEVAQEVKEPVVARKSRRQEQAAKKKKVVSTKGRQVKGKGKKAAPKKKATANKAKEQQNGKVKVQQNGKPSLRRASTLPVSTLASETTPAKKPLHKTKSLARQKTLTKSSSQSSQLAVAKSVLSKAVSLTRSLSQGCRKKEKMKKAIKKVAKEGKKFIKDRNPKPNQRLIPNPDIVVPDKDPFFETREEIPFVSSKAHSRLVTRAVLLKDHRMLRDLINDKEQVSQLEEAKSLSREEPPLYTAIKLQDMTAVRMLHEELYGSNPKKPRAPRTQSILQAEGTGRYNPLSLGIRRTRKLQLSRGGREGNNALVKDLEESEDKVTMVDFAIENNISFANLKILQNIFKENNNDVYESVYKAVRCGHRKLAAALIKSSEAFGGFGFNSYHREALDFDGKESWKLPIRAPSVTKKPHQNRNVTPLHCAAINPNSKYLECLLGVTSEINIEDQDKWRPIHYAAVCQGPGPLKLLINKGSSVEECTKDHYSPLALAALNGRLANVKVLLEKMQEITKTAEPVMIKKYGEGFINKPLKTSWTPLHYAAYKGHLDVVQYLIENGANANKKLNATCEGLSCLMLAAQEGHYDLVKYLVYNGAKIELKDKFGRTALIHAVKDGNTRVAAYLLSRGANPNLGDSSGNTPLHYAVAYGWYSCMKLLLDAGASPDAPNMWGLTPVAASYMKGHTGLTYLLLDIPGININFQDDQGRSLIMNAIHHRIQLDNAAVKEITFLVKEKSANVNLIDRHGANILHYVVKARVDYETYDFTDKSDNRVDQRDEAVRALQSLAELVVAEGCDVNAVEDNDMTPLLALLHRPAVQLHRPVLELLLSKSKTLMSPGETTILHHLLKDIFKKDLLEILTLLKNSKFIEGGSGEDDLRQMMNKQDTAHITPLYQACQCYSEMVFQSSWSIRERGAYVQRGLDVLKFLADLGGELQYSYQYTNVSDGKIMTGKKSVVPLLLGVRDYQGDEAGYELTPRLAFEALSQGKTCDMDFPQESTGHPILYRFVRDNMDIVMVKYLLKKGANVNYAAKAGEEKNITPLLYAVEGNREKSVSVLLEHGADLKAVKEPSKMGCLHLAVTDRLLPMTKLLLSKGADLEARDKEGRTVLHVIAHHATDSADQSKDLEQYLLRHGADTLARDNHGRIPLHYVFHKSWSRTTAFDPVESYSNFAAAMKHQNLDTPDNHATTPLHCAAERGATVCCMLLLQKGCSINAKTKDGNTPLSLAVKNGHDSCVLMLMQKGADISVEVITDPNADKPPVTNAQDDVDGLEEDQLQCDYDDWYYNAFDDGDNGLKKQQRQKLLKNIKSRKKKPVWKWLHTHHEKPWKPGKRGYPVFEGLIKQGWQGLTYVAMDLLEPFGMSICAAVEIVLRLGKYRFAKTLMEKVLENPVLLEKNSRQQNLLHVLTESFQGSDHELPRWIVEDLIKRGVCISDQDDNGFTPLQYSLRNLSIPHIITEFKDEKLTKLQDKYGRCPLAALMWNLADTHANTVKTYIEKCGLEVNALFDFCPVDTFRGCPKPHLDPTDYHVQYDMKISPLMHAVCHRAYKTVKQLLILGASVNLATKDGVTPLMFAVRMNDIKMVELLLHPDPVQFSVSDYDKKLAERKKKIVAGELQLAEPTDKKPLADIERMQNTRKDIQMGAVDSHGWSVLHHMVNSTPVGAYENLTMLRHLVDAGAPLQIKDRQSLTPLQHALRRGATRLAHAMQYLMARNHEEWESPKHEQPSVKDDTVWEWVSADFTADAKDMVRDMEDKQMQVDDKFTPEPDSRASMVGKTFQVVQNTEDETYYDILMNKVDVRIGEAGLYNFYKMQVLKVKEEDLYILFTCWGRIGDSGQYQKTPFSTKEAAITEFCKIFKAKTGNEWAKLKEFENQPKLYRLVDVMYRKVEHTPEVYFELKSELPSKLSPYMQDMMMEMASISMMKNMMKKSGVRIPFGHLKKDALLKAIDLLQQLKDVVKRKEELDSDLQTKDLEEYQQVLEKIWQMSTEYYYLIPKHGFEFERLPPIYTNSNIEQECRTICKLLDLEYAGRLLVAAQHRSKEINPLDYIYRAMGTCLAQLTPSDPMVKMIMQYMYNTCNTSVGVEAVYVVSRPGENERLAACNLGNHKLLWHGTRTSNLISIISRGLLVAPPEAPQTGSAYGKGIYTTNSFQLSQNYSHNEVGGNTKYMLLCEVALGKEYGQDYSHNYTKPPEGYDSIRVNATLLPDKDFNVALPNGAHMPLGRMVDTDEPYEADNKYKNRYNQYNQFVVFREDQVALRYIVQYRESL